MTASPKTLRDVLAPIRDLLAFALLGASALALLAALTMLAPTRFERGFTAGYTLYLGIRPPGFVTLLTVVLPVLAVLLATGLGSPSPRAKLITMFAAIVLAVSIVFSLIFELLLGFIGVVAEFSFVDGVKTVLLRELPRLLLAAIGLLVVGRIWQGMFHVPKPAPQPQAGWEHYHQQAQGYPQGYGQPAQPASGQPQSGPAPQPGQGGYGQPTYVPQQQPYGYGQSYAGPAGSYQPDPAAATGYPSPTAFPGQPGAPGTGQPSVGGYPTGGTAPGGGYGQPAPADDPERTRVVPTQPVNPATGDAGDSGDERWRPPQG